MTIVIFCILSFAFLKLPCIFFGIFYPLVMSYRFLFYILIVKLSLARSLPLEVFPYTIHITLFLLGRQVNYESLTPKIIAFLIQN